MARWEGIKTIADFPQPEVIVWEDNWEVFMLYARNQSQWRSSGDRVIGLDYNVIYSDMTLRAIPVERQKELMSDLLTIEAAARKYI